MILAFDLETQWLAGEVEEQYAAELGGASPWERPDLFGFACGVIVDAETGKAWRYGTGEAAVMLEKLREAETTVGYNSAAFDLGVLSAYGDVGTLWERHVDLYSVVRDKLDVLASEKQTGQRLRQGGLNGLAKSNGLAGKEGDGVRAVELYRDGKLTDLLSYCEADARLTADLHRIARERGNLQVDAYHRDAERNRIYLPRITLPIFL